MGKFKLEVTGSKSKRSRVGPGVCLVRQDRAALFNYSWNIILYLSTVLVSACMAHGNAKI